MGIGRKSLWAAALCLGVLNLMGWERSAIGQETGVAPVAGLKDNTPTLVALVGGKVYVKPGTAIDNATLVIENGRVVSVLEGGIAPLGARVMDVSGKVIYPGFIDAYSELSAEAMKADVGGGAGGGGVAGGYWNSQVKPEREAARLYSADVKADAEYRGQGVVARLVAPGGGGGGGIVKGVSGVVWTNASDEPGKMGSEKPAETAILKQRGMLHVAIQPTRGREEGYPTSPMGAFTLVRQVFYDAAWYGEMKEKNPTGLGGGLQKNDALEAVVRVRAEKAPVMVDTVDDLYAMRADRLAREFDLPVVLRGSGQEYRQLAAIKASGRAVVVPVNYPKAPFVASADAAGRVTLEELMSWDLSPENPGRLAKAGVKIALTGQGLKERKEFLAAVKKAVKRGLPADAALAALTVNPAEMLGVGDVLGTLEAGKSASFVVAEGELFLEGDGGKAAKGRIESTWVNGRVHDVAKMYPNKLEGVWEMVIGDVEKGGTVVRLEVKTEGGGGGKLSAAVVSEKEGKRVKKDIKQLDMTDKVMSFLLPELEQETGEQLKGEEGAGEKKAGVGAAAVRWRVTVGILGDTMRGLAEHAGGRAFVTAKRVGELPEEDATKAEADEEKKDEAAGGDKKEEKKEPKKTEIRTAMYEPNYPLGEYGRASLPEPGGGAKMVAFTNCTVWTGSEKGILENATVVIGDGKIVAVVEGGGGGGAVPEGAEVIDAKGMHLTAGIIDCHSHMATDGGVNEAGQAVTAEVRIGDFINPEDVNIYRQLAGGVTGANILHGSANPIGGQNQVIKLRWGATDEGLKNANAPQGIKFALGENVKQSNWGERNVTRYPQTRMGVPEIIADRFRAARDYRAAQKRAKEGSGPAVRVDLELEAIAEILEGTRLIHCHSYRQDEILAFLRTCEAFGVKVATLQHILEGYKVAEAIKAHGAMASCFTDWWGYKVEVDDAIANAAEIMHNAGIVVSFNSDDAELARRMNLEAAKAVKYGNIDRHEAWKMVTLNPAKQLHIDKWVGSVEAGKDADVVLWSGDPLDSTSKAMQTWIDGRKYFDLKDDAAMRAEIRQRREALISRVIESGEEMAGPDERGGTLRPEWATHDEFCRHSK